MEEINLKVSELYDLKALALGLDIVEQSENGPKRTTIIDGFINETQVPEGVKRRVNRAGKVLEDQVQLINLQRRKVVEDVALSLDEKKQKDTELMNDTITVSIEKVDFSKIEDLTLKFNYQFLYEKLFN
jgi:hypothetical protein